MSAVNFSVREFYDQSSEYIGIKSGLLLDRQTLKRILQEQFQDEFLKLDDNNQFIRLQVDYAEDMFRFIRRRIGNLPEKSALMDNLKVIGKYYIKIGDPMGVGFVTSIAFRYLNNRDNIPLSEIALEISQSEGFPIEIATAIAQYGFERYDQSCIMPSNKTFSVDNLKSLFDHELTSIVIF